MAVRHEFAMSLSLYRRSRERRVVGISLHSVVCGVRFDACVAWSGMSACTCVWSCGVDEVLIKCDLACTLPALLNMYADGCSHPQRTGISPA